MVNPKVHKRKKWNPQPGTMVSGAEACAALDAAGTEISRQAAELAALRLVVEDLQAIKGIDRLCDAALADVPQVEITTLDIVRHALSTAIDLIANVKGSELPGPHPKERWLEILRVALEGKASPQPRGSGRNHEK